jgi:hypothetical protein
VVYLDWNPFPFLGIVDWGLGDRGSGIGDRGLGVGGSGIGCRKSDLSDRLNRPSPPEPGFS